jgi:hypothetical protein
MRCGDGIVGVATRVVIETGAEVVLCRGVVRARARARARVCEVCVCVRARGGPCVLEGVK